MCSEEKCRECKWKDSCANNCEKPSCYKPREETVPVNPSVPYIATPVIIYPPLNPTYPDPYNPSPWINPFVYPQITWSIKASPNMCMCTTDSTIQ